MPILLLVVFLAAAGTGPSVAHAGGPAAKSASAPVLDPTTRRAEAYFYVMESRLAAGRGRVTESVSALQKAIEAVPDSGELRGEAAMILLHLGRHGEAEKAARAALALNSDEPAALRVVADLAARRALGPDGERADREEAIAFYGKLAQDPSADDEIFPILARLRLLGGDAPGAVLAARSFADRRPGDSAAARLLAQYLERDGRKEEALDVLAAFFRSNPDAEEILLPLGDLGRETDRWDSIVTACSVALQADPNRPAPRALRGEALLRLGRQMEAISDFESVRDLVPENRLALFQLATAYGEVGRLGDAADLASRLAEELPDHAGIRSFLGEVLARQGDLEGASAAFGFAIARLRTDEPEAAERRDDMRRRLCTLFLSRSRASDAARVAGEFERPDSIESLEIRARIAIASKDGERARDLAKRLRSRGEKGVAAIVEAESWILEGRVDRARARYGEAASLLGGEVWGDAAESFLEAGRIEEAERLMRSAVARDPKSAAARLRLGAFLERQKRFGEADVELREAIRIDPNDAVALNYLGYSLADRGIRLEEALALVRRALEVDRWNAAYLDSLGWALFRLGRFEEARVPIERAARDYPFDPTVLEHLGDVYERLGESEKARVAWLRSIEAGAGNADDLREKLDAAAAGSRPPVREEPLGEARARPSSRRDRP